MERYSGNRWSKGFGLMAAALILISLLSFHPFDPTIANLLYPANGVGNALGLAGALLGGSLVEFLGMAALLIPALVVNWFFQIRRRPRVLAYVAYSAILLLFAGSFHGLLTDDPFPSPWRPGLLGWAGGRWAESTLGPIAGGALLFAGFAYCFAQVAYVVPWRLRAMEGAAFARYLLRAADGARRQSGETAGEAMHALARMGEAGLDALVLRTIAGGRALFRWAARINPPAYRPAIPARNWAPPAPELRRRPSGGSSAGPDGFDAWFEDSPPPTRGEQPRPIDPEPPANAAKSDLEREAEKIAKWEEHLRRYRENLDLDWDERVLGEAPRRNREGESEEESGGSG